MTDNRSSKTDAHALACRPSTAFRKEHFAAFDRGIERADREIAAITGSSARRPCRHDQHQGVGAQRAKCRRVEPGVLNLDSSDPTKSSKPSHGISRRGGAATKCGSPATQDLFARIGRPSARRARPRAGRRPVEASRSGYHLRFVAAGIGCAPNQKSGWRRSPSVASCTRFGQNVLHDERDWQWSSTRRTRWSPGFRPVGGQRKKKRPKERWEKGTMGPLRRDARPLSMSSPFDFLVPAAICAASLEAWTIARRGMRRQRQRHADREIRLCEPKQPMLGTFREFCRLTARRIRWPKTAAASRVLCSLGAGTRKKAPAASGRRLETVGPARVWGVKGRIRAMDWRYFFTPEGSQSNTTRRGRGEAVFRPRQPWCGRRSTRRPPAVGPSP